MRCLHACWLTADGRFALYAGQTTGVRALGDLWALDGGQWTMVDGELPPERNLPAATRHGDDAIVFGGLGLDGDYLRDVYRVDGTTLAFEELQPRAPGRPPGPARHSSTTPATVGSCSSAAPPATRSPTPGS